MIKNWEDLTIADNFIFAKVLETDPACCKRLLEMILGFEIDSIAYPEREKTIETRLDSKGIRLDVYVKTADGQKIFDVEIQTTNNDNLAKRMRYYQALIDNDALDKGKYYSDLATTYVIFICTFDYFKQGRHIYTFRNRCEQDNSLLLGDESTKIFLNTNGTMNDVDQNLLDFLNYIVGVTSSNPFVKELDDKVQMIKQNKQWRNDYMRWKV